MVYSAMPMMLTHQTPVLAAGAMSEMLVYLLPVLGSMLLCYGVYQVVTESKTSSRKRMQDRLRGKRTHSEKTVESILRRGAMNETRSFADAIASHFKFTPRLQRMLDQADLDWSASNTLLNLIGLSLLTGLGLVMLQFNPIVAVGCAAAVLVLPLFWLSLTRKRRMTKLVNQLPDVFDMMSQALQAGHSLAGAVQLIYEQMPPPIANEFAQVYHEQNLGIKIEDALQSMAERVDSLDVRFFVTAVIIQRQTGGDLAEILENISGVIRERIELAGLVRGLTAEGRLSGWVLFALPFMVFFATMIMNPNYVEILFRDPRGQLMLVVAGGMQLMGIAMIRWIVNIKM